MCVCANNIFWRLYLGMERKRLMRTELERNPLWSCFQHCFHFTMCIFYFSHFNSIVNFSKYPITIMISSHLQHIPTLSSSVVHPSKQGWNNLPLLHKLGVSTSWTLKISPFPGKNHLNMSDGFFPTSVTWEARIPYECPYFRLINAHWAPTTCQMLPSLRGRRDIQAKMFWLVFGRVGFSRWGISPEVALGSLAGRQREQSICSLLLASKPETTQTPFTLSALGWDGQEMARWGAALVAKYADKE